MTRILRKKPIDHYFFSTIRGFVILCSFVFSVVKKLNRFDFTPDEGFPIAADAHQAGEGEM